jgi:hypothetical protein
VYFGYGQIWRFAFVPVAFAIVMAAFVALCLVYAVGASKGGRAAGRYLTVTTAVFAAASVVTLLWALISGQFAGFLGAYGWGPIVELSMLALLCLGSMGFMAGAYVRTKVDDPAE